MTDIPDVCGIIFDIDNFAAHDGPGIRTVIYLKGCPLRCAWCHSPESQLKEPQTLNMPGGAQKICGRLARAAELVNETLAYKPFFDSSGGGVTLSGGEVLFQPEFAEALLKQFQSHGVHTIVETSGMGGWEHLRRIARYTDIFYYDIKSFDNDKHKIYTGAENAVILDNLKKLCGHISSGKVELRIPLIPGYNDSEDEILKIYGLARELRIQRAHLLPYNLSAPAKYEWLGLPYKLGNLTKQSGGYTDKLREMAPEGLYVTVEN